MSVMSTAPCPMPSGALRLHDGRLLLYRGSRSVDGVGPAPFNIQVQHIWSEEKSNGMRCLASHDAVPDRGWILLHVSVSYAQRPPTWTDLHLVKRAFFGDDREAMQVLPREADYINIHRFTFHLWQLPSEWGLL